MIMSFTYNSATDLCCVHILFEFFGPPPNAPNTPTQHALSYSHTHPIPAYTHTHPNYCQTAAILHRWVGLLEAALTLRFGKNTSRSTVESQGKAMFVFKKGCVCCVL